MKRTIAITIIMAVAMMALVPASYAGVVDSRHDMASGSNPYATLSAFADYGACSACHIPHGAVGQRLFPNVGITPAGASVLGFFGPLCQTCHDNSIPGGTVDIYTNDTALQGHGITIASIQAVDQDEQIATSGLPYTTGDAPSGAGNIECLSCHDVHNTVALNGRPFMAAPLDDLCESCHTNRVNNDTATTGYLNAAGIHPAGPVFTGDVGDGVATNAGNSPFVAGWGTEFTQNPDVGSDGSTWTDTNWDSGLQLSGQGAAGTGGVDCISCHNVHYDEDDGTPSAGSTLYLAMVTEDANTGLNNTVCEYCHQGAALDASYGYTASAAFPNPGGTGFTHPNDDFTAANAAVQASVDFNWQPTTVAMPGGVGTSASALYCTSCHGVHPNTTPAGTETMADTPVLLNYGAEANICNACHAGAAGFQHHPVGGTYATLGSSVGGVTCSGGDLEGYNTCHGTNAGGNGSVAHNRIDPISAPGVPGPDRCEPCHTGNPGTYAVTQTGGVPYTAGELGTHFVGDASALGFNNGPTTRAAAADPIRYAGTGLSNDGGSVNWVGSGLPSLFGPGGATDFICESCHRLAGGNVLSGDGNTALLVEDSGAAITTVASTPSGAVANYTAAPYICTGCHLVPGGTHPLEDGDGTQYPAGGWTEDQGQSYNANTTLNCESCHSPHNAATDGGQYILDGSAGGDYRTPAGNGDDWEPPIDYTTFCAVCHGAFQ